MKRKSYLPLAVAMLAMAGCNQSDYFDTKQNADHLNASVQGIKSSQWETKTRAADTAATAADPANPATPADTLWLNDSIYVEAVIGDLTNDLPDNQAPKTRATPITTGSQITKMSIVTFKTNSSIWSSSSSQETNPQSPIKATLKNGNYDITPAYAWQEGDMDRRTFIAMSPYHDSAGFSLNTDGQTMTVEVPTDVTQQHDLCVSDISKNQNVQNPIGSNNNRQSFELIHVMTAIGFDAVGYDLVLTSVKFIDVYSEGTLTLHSRTWSARSTPATFAAKINSNQQLKSEHIESGNPWYNITANDGYLMMLPQSHTDDMKLQFSFNGANGQPGGTYTLPLNRIMAPGATSSEWKPGMRITYRLRLKTRPAVRNDRLVIADNAAGSTTPALDIVTSTDDDLTFSWTASWLGMYRGTSTTVSSPESNGFFTPFATGVNSWTNLKFFARSDNNSTVTERTATVTVTGKKSGVRTFTVAHPKKWVGPPINPPIADDYIIIDNLKWGKGNLIAKNRNECKMGAVTDDGLYFYYGSLVGWAGGANGDGTGRGQLPPSQYVKPIGYSGSTSWSSSVNAPGAPCHAASAPAGYGYGLPATDNPSTGVGDPCRYYLGEPWRTPTAGEYQKLIDMGSVTVNSGTWLGRNPGSEATSIFFLWAGFRDQIDGKMFAYGNDAAYGTGSLYSYGNTYGLRTLRRLSKIDYFGKTYGQLIRCVSPLK